MKHYFRRMKRPLRQIFIENLKYYRQKCGLAQQELAAKIDKSVNYINGIENNNTFPSIETIEKIADVLSVKPAVLFDENGCPENAIVADKGALAHELGEILYTKIRADIVKDIEYVLCRA